MLDLGGFKVKLESDEDYEYVLIESISGNWSMDFRSDNPKYGLLVEMINDEDFHEALKGQIVVWYHFANCMPDAEFMEDFINAYGRFGQRMVQKSE